MTQTAPETSDATTRPRIPTDSTFGARLAMVRQMMRWGNVAEAARECGLPTDSWRNWEEGREPRRLVTVALAIATRANVDLDWLVYGPNKPGQGGGKVNVDYPSRLDPLAPRRIRRVGEDANGIVRGDGRRRPNRGARASDGRGRQQTRTVSLANHTAPAAIGSVA